MIPCVPTDRDADSKPSRSRAAQSRLDGRFQRLVAHRGSDALRALDGARRLQPLHSLCAGFGEQPHSDRSERVRAIVPPAGLAGSHSQRQRLAVCLHAGSIGSEPSVGLVAGIGRGPGSDSARAAGSESRTSECIGTLLGSWNATPRPRSPPNRRPWTYGAPPTTPSVRTRLWGCRFPPICTFPRRAASRRTSWCWSTRRSILRRHVGPSGAIKVHNIRIPVSEALAGWDVGLKYEAAKRYGLWFCRLRLGEVDLETQKFTAVKS